jgi:crossover junction endodeoxyribonuclease RuvC
MIIGIDPGKSGSIVVLLLDGTFVDALPMPTIKTGKSSRVNAAAVVGFLNEYRESVKHCYIEQVGAMPGQGVSSMFSFGHSAGVMEGLIAGMGIPYSKITPQAWKKTYGLIGKEKDASRSRAVELYPQVRLLDLKEKGQAVADAIFIARHGAGV